jgi:hypothetical protein
MQTLVEVWKQFWKQWSSTGRECNGLLQRLPFSRSLTTLSSSQLNSGTASNCFSGVSGWNRRGKEFRRHKSFDVRNLCPIESIMHAA